MWWETIKKSREKSGKATKKQRRMRYMGKKKEEASKQCQPECCSPLRHFHKQVGCKFCEMARSLSSRYQNVALCWNNQKKAQREWSWSQWQFRNYGTKRRVRMGKRDCVGIQVKKIERCVDTFPCRKWKIKKEGKDFPLATNLFLFLFLL